MQSEIIRAAVMSIVLMLMLLVGSFLLLWGLVGFCENIIEPASVIGRASPQHHGPTTGGEKIVQQLPSTSSG
jgi:hypothetical protein